MNTSILQLLNLPIRRDADGRYCLNDLHKAAGGLARHKPSEWLRNKSTKAQIDVLSSGREFPPRVEPVVTVSVGAPSTYIVKELVYAYAMWISPAFYIQVIRAYDALVTGQYVKPLTQAEKYWFTRRPHWQSIRALVFDGMTYATVALRLGRSVGSVGRCIRRMIEVGLINPVEFIRLRYLPRTAERLVAANKQMCLDWGVAA